MRDILEAIQKEKEYLSFRMKDEEPYHLVDAVKEYGYNSLDEYFAAKRRYEISHTPVVKVKSAGFNGVAVSVTITDK